MTNVTKNAPGRTMLLVTGILFIVFNAFSFLFTPVTLLTIDWWLMDFGGEAMRDTWVLYYSLSMILSIFAVIVGILGVAFCNKIHKAGMLLVLAIICVALTLIYDVAYTVAIISNSAGGFLTMGVTTVISIPIGLIVPILLIVGAAKNKKAANFDDEYGGRRY